MTKKYINMISGTVDSKTIKAYKIFNTVTLHLLEAWFIQALLGILSFVTYSFQHCTGRHVCWFPL